MGYQNPHSRLKILPLNVERFLQISCETLDEVLAKVLLDLRNDIDHEFGQDGARSRLSILSSCVRVFAPFNIPLHKITKVGFFVDLVARH